MPAGMAEIGKINLTKSILEDPGVGWQTAGGCAAPHEKRLLRLLHLHDRRGANHRLQLHLLRLILLILPIVFCVLFQVSNDSLSVFHSLLYLLYLALDVVPREVDPLPQFVHIGHVLLRKK
jgi:hypothetical protein